MAFKGGNLKAAHRGYRYQDIATAFFLAASLTDRYSELIVDCKQVQGDVVDDLELTHGTTRVRRQFKSSENASRALEEADFTKPASSLRIDYLVLTFIRAGDKPADEYRLCATWSAPASADPLYNLIVRSDSPKSFSYEHSDIFKLDGSAIWPADAAPIWDPLKEHEEIDRNAFLLFCDRFFIEVGIPQSSNSLAEPAALENLLLRELATRVGIGRYPNANRAVEDVAALAVSLANLARTQSATITPLDVERELAIRTDYGRVVQAFPIDTYALFERPTFRKELSLKALDGISQIVVAPPGAGKSWELTQLADELSKTGALVARHYCYLEPGDELVERRVTSEVFFGNLLAELVDSAPELRGASLSRYSAGLVELEETLVKASANGVPVVLIIDGIDHIARVRSSSSTLTADDTDIIEQLATLNLPPGVAIVVGTQPGTHIDALLDGFGKQVVRCDLPPWSHQDVIALAKIQGIATALSSFGLTETESDAVLQELANNVDGNPLYGRYLSLQLASSLADGIVTDPLVWLRDLPATGGSISKYYARIYAGTNETGHIIADALGFVDFAVTEDQLSEILPPLLRPWIASALKTLKPVLTEVSGQGGVRVYHESFRRFMTDELVRRNRSVAEALRPVISWLENRGFFRDARSFRFLLPALTRAARDEEVLAIVATNYISESVQQAYPFEVIERNLALASEVAARRLDWPALTRFMELRRCLDTWFDESQGSWEEFSRTFVTLFGPEALAERLLFDGRATQGRSRGLLACQIIDRAGGNAPWLEYIDLPEETDRNYGDIGAANGLSSNERVALAELCGSLRLGHSEIVAKRVSNYIKRATNDASGKMLRAVASAISHLDGPSAVLPLIAKAAEYGTRTVEGTAASSMLELGICDALSVENSTNDVVSYSNTALGGIQSAELALECLEYGAELSECVKRAVNPTLLSIAVGPDHSVYEDSQVRLWVASVRLLANNGPAGEAKLQEELGRIAGAGWYRCWLTYIIELATFEARKRRSEDATILDAFDRLTQDVRPFSGDPRACDLYALRDIIEETIAQGLTYVEGSAEWERVLGILRIVSRETSSRMDRELGGPFTTDAFITCLASFVDESAIGSIVAESAEQELLERDGNGTYYATHAELYLKLARIREAAGHHEAAIAAWSRMSVFLAAYGFHKDGTIFELIASAPSLSAISNDYALSALVQLQPLTNAVLAHTDGRSTKHAPNAWLRSLAKISPANALEVLACTVSSLNDTRGWPIADGIRDTISRAREGGASPSLLDGVLRTVRFVVEADNVGKETADARMASAVDLATADVAEAEQMFRQIVAEVVDDGWRHNRDAALRVAETAASVSIRVPSLIASEIKPTEWYDQAPRGQLNGRSHDFDVQDSPFPVGASVVDVLRGIRKQWQNKQWRATPEDSAGAMTSLSYLLTNLADVNRSDDVHRILVYFARTVDTYLYGELPHPLSQLAETLRNAGYQEFAAFAFALAFMASRDGWGSRFTEKHASLAAQAMDIDRTASLRVFADELAFGLRSKWYGFGVTGNMIERLSEWGETEIAAACWQSAFAVIEHRLPLAPGFTRFAQLDLTSLHEWTIDQAIVALLLAQLSDPRLREKFAALAAFATATFMLDTASLDGPLSWWLESGPLDPSLVLILDLLWQGERKPYTPTPAVATVLSTFAASATWPVSVLSRRLLNRADIEAPAYNYQSPADCARYTNELTTRHLHLLSAGDLSDSLLTIEAALPGISDRIARRFNALIDTEDAKAHYHNIFEIMFDDDGKRKPPVKVLRFESEAFLKATFEELSIERRSECTAFNSGDSSTDERVLSALMPNTRLHISISLSRSPRPNWEMPAQVTAQNKAPAIVGNDDPRYEGWVRLGLIESQYLRPSEDHYAEAIAVIDHYAAVVAVKSSSQIPSDVVPFWEFDALEWWEANSDRNKTKLSRGAVVGLINAFDWLESVKLLMPPIALKRYTKIVPPGFAEPLIWRDDSAQQIAAIRVWQKGSRQSMDADSTEFAGADLIVRPDLAKTIKTICDADLFNVFLTTRRDL